MSAAVPLYHDVTGPDGAPVLLMGGSLGTTLATWDPQLGPLAARLRVVRFDHRGHGASPVPPGPYAIEDLGRDVLALLDRLGIARASYGGLSLGGMVGMWLAAHAPERIDRLVLLCTSAHLPPSSLWANRAATVRTAGTVAVIADSVVARWLTPAFAEEHPELVKQLRSMLSATSPDGYADCCLAIARMDLRADLAAVRAATLVVAGCDDPATPPDHARAIVAAIPAARLELVGAAHLANIERATEVSGLILDHLREAA